MDELPPDAADPAGELEALYRSHLGETGGFLPVSAPLATVAPPFQLYLDLSRELPEHYPSRLGGVRRWLDRSLPDYTTDHRSGLMRLQTAEQERLMTSLSALAHTYRWDALPPAPERFAEKVRLPDALGSPWEDLAQALEVPRVGSAWSLHVGNWKSDGVAPGSAYRADQLSINSMDVIEQWLPDPYDSQFRYFSLTFV